MSADASSENKKAIIIPVVIFLFLLLTAGTVYVVRLYAAKNAALQTASSPYVYQDLPLELEPEPYDLIVSQDIKGGNITLNRTEALFGETVLVSVVPDKGKRLSVGSLKARSDGKTLSVVNSAFCMPDGNAEISAKFSNTLDGIYLDPRSLLHGQVYLWKDDDATVHVRTNPHRGYALAEVAVTDEPVSGAKNTHTFVKREDIDATVLVNWDSVEYSISYNPNGGEITQLSDVLSRYTISSDSYALPEASRIGYTFLGWTEDSDSQSILRDMLPSTTGDLTYTANWAAIEYEITYNDLFNKTEYTPDVYTTNAAVSLPQPQKRGYEFLGWYENPQYSGNVVSSIPAGSIGDKALYAKWAPVQYHVSFALNGGHLQKNSAAFSAYTISSSPYQLPQAEKEGYRFCGWSERAHADNLLSEIPSDTIGSLSFVAQWEPLVYYIDYKDENRRTLYESSEYTVEQYVSLPQPQKKGYDFAGWYESPSYTGNPLYRISAGTTGSKTLFVRWKPTEYTATLHLYGSKTDKLSFNRESADTPLPNPVRTGWSFAGWYTDRTCNGGSATRIPHGSEGARDFYAKWNCTVSFETDGGTLCEPIPISSQNAVTGDLPQSEREYYTFAGWYADKERTKLFTAATAVQGDTVLYAKWDPVAFSITYNTNGGELPFSYMKEYTVETKQSSLPVPQREGWAFGGWYADPNFKTPVSSAMKSGTNGSRNLFSRRMKTSATAAAEAGQLAQSKLTTDTANYSTSSAVPNTFRGGLLSMNSLYEQNSTAIAKVEINSDITVYAKWFKFDVKVIPAGKFIPAESATTIEDIPHDLEVSTSEITRGTYLTVMGKDPSDSTASLFASEEEKLENPVQQVSWFDALVFCNKLSMLNGVTPVYSIKGSTNPDDWGAVPDSNDLEWVAVVWDKNANGYRLPTEKEWMWCAMSGPYVAADLNEQGVNVNGYKKRFAGHEVANLKKNSKEIKKYAWYTSNSLAKTHPAGTTFPNEAGLQDMSGNVWEWCWDPYELTAEEKKELVAEKKDASYTGEFFRTICGGSWYSFPSLVAISSRMSLNIYGRNTITGFRVVRTIKKL